MPHPLRKTWLLGFSPDRTLIVRSNEEGQVVVKLFESGGMAAAEREADLARRLAGPNTAPPLAVTKDRETGKPAITIQYLDGRDLESTVLDQGALPSHEVLPLAHSLAQILERIHATRDASAPDGYVHGDIKPANLLREESGKLILLDFEHSVAHAPSAVPTGQFSGGTSGYAPPESYGGCSPTPAFDVFGFGCTVHFLLCGAPPYADDDALRQDRRRRRVLMAQRGPLRQIIDDCLAVNPDARPTAHDLAVSLAILLEPELDASKATSDTQQDQDLDRVLQAILLGDLSEAETQLAEITEQSPRRRAVESLHSHAVRLMARIDAPIALDAEPRTEAPQQLLKLAAHLTQAAPRTAAFRRRFPNHVGARQSRVDLLQARNTVLVSMAAAIQTAKNDAQFELANALLKQTREAVQATAVLGRLQPAELGIELTPSPMQRGPNRFLNLHQRGIDQAVKIHAAMLGDLEQAEARLDLDLAGKVIREFAEIYGGASRVVAELKDRLHRLDFYLDRIGRMMPLLQGINDEAKVADLEIDLSPTASFFEACRDRITTDSDVFGAPTTENLRTLRRSLVDLLRDYPHLDATAQRALDALDTSLTILTESAWNLLREAEHKLATPPIPIRPLQSIINRLDDLRMRELLVDLSDRPRTRLIDEMESVRARLDQARSTRDSIARGARESMKQGHLTTAIYDMKRAVDQFGDDEQEAVEPGNSPRLAEQFEEARRRKQQVELAQQRNHALAADYAELAANTDSDRTERLAILEEREELLLFLCQNSGAERATNYRRDLNEAHVAYVRERSADGESLLVDAETRSQRLAVVEQTLSALRQHAPEVGVDHPEVEASLQHWQDLYDETSRTITQPKNPEQARSRWPIPTMAALLLVAIGFAIYPQLANAGRLGLDTLAETLERELPTNPTEAKAAELLIALQRYVAELRQTNLELPAGLADDARRFVEAAEKTAADRTTLAEFAVAVQGFDAAIPKLRSPWSRRPDATLVIASLQRFGRYAHLYGFLGAKNASPEDRAQHDSETKDLDIRLPSAIAGR